MPNFDDLSEWDTIKPDPKIDALMKKRGRLRTALEKGILSPEKYFAQDKPIEEELEKLQVAKTGQARQTGSSGMFLELTGKVLNDKYRVIKEIGSGGMGIVYRAVDKEFEGEREVAIKLLPDWLRQDAEGLKGFKQEFLTATKLQHQNICGMYEFGEDKKLRAYYLVLELLQGKSLRTLVREKGKIDYPEGDRLSETSGGGAGFCASKKGVAPGRKAGEYDGVWTRA